MIFAPEVRVVVERVYVNGDLSLKDREVSMWPLWTESDELTPAGTLYPAISAPGAGTVLGMLKVPTGSFR